MVHQKNNVRQVATEDRIAVVEPLPQRTVGLEIAEKNGAEARVVAHIVGSKAAEERMSVRKVVEHGTDALTVEPSIEEDTTEEKRYDVGCGGSGYTAIPDDHASHLVRGDEVEHGSGSLRVLLLLVLQLQ